MTTVWVRGPVCGTDNCRSKLWRSTDGLQICQYGHVRDGAVEFNDDEEEYVQTRRLNITNAKHQARLTQLSELNRLEEAKKKKFSGERGWELCLRCFQVVLRRQVQWLVREKGLPLVLEETVRGLWAEYLQAFVMLRAASNTNGHGLESLPAEEPRRAAAKRALPKLPHTLSLLYLACVRLQLPVYLNDLMSWASSNKLPYMKIIDDGSIIPRTLMRNLPQYYMRLFAPSKPPLKGELYFHTCQVVKQLPTRDYTPPMAPLLFQLVHLLVLPPRVYTLAERYLRANGITMRVPASEGKLLAFPELRVASALITSAKLYFLNLGPEAPAAEVVPYDRWERVYTAYTQSLRTNLSNTNRYFDTMLNSLLVEPDNPTEVLEMNGNNTEQYLEWFANNIIDTDETRPEREMRDVSIVQKRLLDIFQLRRKPDHEAGGASQAATETPQAATEIPDLRCAYAEMQRPGDGETPSLVRGKPSFTVDACARLEALLVDVLAIRMGVTRTQLRACVKWSDAFLQ